LKVRNYLQWGAINESSRTVPVWKPGERWHPGIADVS
jgi:hypothetical protein